MQQACLVQSLAIVHADALWCWRLFFKIAHGFTHPSFQDVIPQIEIDFQIIISGELHAKEKQVVFHHRDDIGSSFCFLGSCTKLMPLLSNAEVRINCRGQRFYSIANMMMCFSRHMYGASLSLRPHQSNRINRSSDQLALIYRHETHLYDKKWCALSFLKDMLCVLQFKKCFTNRCHSKYHFALQFVCNRILRIAHNLTIFCLHCNSI